MGNIIQFIREKLGLNVESSRPGILDAIELVVDNSCPKIRLIRGYRKKLRQPVESALGYIAELIEKIPGPLDVTSDSAVEDVLVKAFFINKDQLKTTLTSDPDLNEYLSQKPAGDFFVLLTMEHELKTIFGTRLQGEIVLRDVALKSVNFLDHKFRVPSAAMVDLNRSLESGVLQILAHQALENILEEQSRKEELSRLKDEVAVKLKILTAERQQMVLEWNADSSLRLYYESQELLERIEEELNTIKIKTLDLNYYLDQVYRVMNKPDKFITAEPVAMHFDRMGILIEGEESQKKEDVRVLNVKLGDNRRRSTVFLKCNRNTLFNNEH